MVRKESVALIDKVVIKGFGILAVDDYSRLIREGIITKEDGRKNYCYTDKKELYTKVEIKNEGIFDRFFYGMNSSGHSYGRLSISINDKDDHNLNCYTADQYRARIQDIEDLLKTKYGIHVNFKYSTYERIEINTTISLDHDYSDYSRVLDHIASKWSKQLRLKNNNQYENYDKDSSGSDIKDTETISRTSGRRGLDICVYNKNKQMKNIHKMDLPAQYLRYEIRLKSSQKIKNALGTNSIWGLTDKHIQNYWQTHINKDLLKPLEKNNKERRKRILKILQKHFNPGSPTWIVDTLLEISCVEIDEKLPLMLDVEELLPLLDHLNISRQSRCNYKEKFTEIAKRMPGTFSGDNNKLKEIINKL